jgi:UDP-N-acetylmuramyl pentapeptide phosphotransferase/UDP-N-acetylglucosamine-1-phosphate transferase
MIAPGMLLPAVVALLVAASLTPLLARWARNRNLLDVPNQRSSHVVATPRIGGAAFVVAVLAGVATFTVAAGGLTAGSLVVVAAATGLALLGLVDDFRSLPASIRLLVQTAISVLAVVALAVTPFPPNVPGWLAAALTVFWLVALTNAYNFMDGIDGIAAGQALVAGLGWAVLGGLLGSHDTMLLGLLGAVAPAGFLIHNWPPARVFMGDAGSGFLGFFFAALPLTAAGRGPDVLTWAVLLTWPFLFDTGFTLLRRLRRGENIFSAHRSHLYQRLTVSGLPHGRVSLLYSALAAVGAGGAIAHAIGLPGAAGMSAAAVAAAAFGLWRYVVAREARPGVANANPGARP